MLEGRRGAPAVGGGGSHVRPPEKEEAAALCLRTIMLCESICSLFCDVRIDFVDGLICDVLNPSPSSAMHESICGWVFLMC